MENSGKLICGLLATAALGLVSHFGGKGQSVLNTLSANAQSALAQEGIAQVDVAFENAPMRRIALLSGTSDAATRASALAAVRSVPGVMDARWVDMPATSADSAGNAQASSAASTDADAAATGTAKSDTDEGSDGTAGSATSAAPANGTASACQNAIDTAIGARSVHFRSGSPWVNFDARKVLADVAKAVNNCPGAKLVVGGYADGAGADSINKALSQARADAVKAILVEKGLNAERITATGYGSGKSGGSNERDRRTSFTAQGG